MSLYHQTGMVKDRMQTKQTYLGGGRAYAFSTRLSHMYQRAAIKVLEKQESCSDADDDSNEDIVCCGCSSMDDSEDYYAMTCCNAESDDDSEYGFSFMDGSSGNSPTAPCPTSHAYTPCSPTYTPTSPGYSPTVADDPPEVARCNFQTSYMKQMVKKSQLERHANGENEAADD